MAAQGEIRATKRVEEEAVEEENSRALKPTADRVRAHDISSDADDHAKPVESGLDPPMNMRIQAEPPGVVQRDQENKN